MKQYYQTKFPMFHFTPSEFESGNIGHESDVNASHLYRIRKVHFGISNTAPNGPMFIIPVNWKLPTTEYKCPFKLRFLDRDPNQC